MQRRTHAASRILLSALLLAAAPALAQIVPGHRLPAGEERRVREREVDVTRVRAALSFDMEKGEISGTVTMTYTPLKSGLTSLSVDAAKLDVTRVEGDGAPLKFTPRDRDIAVSLALPQSPGETHTVAVTYRARPTTGLYFFPRTSGRTAQMWNYGEGGLHYGWLPLYNDTNDKFAVQLDFTVAKPYVALGNGVLKGTDENPDGTRTFHWEEERPIPNYLIACDVGEFTRVPLDDAAVSGLRVPLAVWTRPGTEAAAKRGFGGTPRMVEFYSRLLSTPYPWPKYDQVVLDEFAVGAMETTSMVGFHDTTPRSEGDPADDAPELNAFPVWTAEDTISHELAHHWFGDLVTCRSLGSIWLNESFASFLHTIWYGEAHGADDLAVRRWVYLNDYLDHVHETGTVRPMEFPKYTSPVDMYQQELTYVKGALVLHMLEEIVGPKDFYRALAAYLAAHADGNVDSADLLAAFEKTAGRNLRWFWDDWVVGGGGHPLFDVSYRYVPERKAVDLTVAQVQADLAFENDFRLPVAVEVVTASGTRRHLVEVSGWSKKVSLPADGKPLTVIFDADGTAVSEVRYTRPLAEVVEQLRKGGLPAKLRAARQLASDFGSTAPAVEALRSVLSDPKAHWGLRQEAAIDLGSCGTPEAVDALAAAAKDPDRRVRRAAAVALGQNGSAGAAGALTRLIASDAAEDVVGVAELSLGKLRAPGTRELLVKQLARASRANDWIRLGALSGLAELDDPSLASVVAPYVEPGHDQRVRLAALSAWRRAAPDDPKLAAKLRALTGDRNREVRGEAIDALAALHHAEDRALFKALSEDPDFNVAQAGKEALETLDAFSPGDATASP